MKIYSNIELIEKYKPQNILNDIKEHFIINKSNLFDLFSKSSCPISNYKREKQLSFIEPNEAEDHDLVEDLMNQLHDAIYFMSLSKKDRTIVTQRMRSFATEFTRSHFERIKNIQENRILELPYSSIEKDKYPLVLKEIDEILKSIMSGLNIELNYWQDLPRASYLSGLQVSMGSFFEKLNKIGMNQRDQITLVQQLFSHFKVDWDEGARGNIKTSLQVPSLEILTSRKRFFDNPMGLSQNSTLSENNINELTSAFYEYRVHLRRF